MISLTLPIFDDSQTINDPKPPPDEITSETLGSLSYPLPEDMILQASIPPLAEDDLVVYSKVSQSADAYERFSGIALKEISKVLVVIPLTL